MAILRSIDGKFYNIPDEQLDQHFVPAEEVKSKLAAAADDSATTDIQVVPQKNFGKWRNCWRNCYRGD